MKIHQVLRIFIALVWLVMGLFCKVLGLEPRHEEIVARILGENVAPTLIIIIGLAEIGMAAWIISGIRPKLCAWLQVTLVAVMNVLEFILARDLLLLGGANALAAVGFIAIILIAEHLRTKECSPN